MHEAISSYVTWAIPCLLIIFSNRDFRSQMGRNNFYRFLITEYEFVNEIALLHYIFESSKVLKNVIFDIFRFNFLKNGTWYSNRIWIEFIFSNKESVRKKITLSYLWSRKEV